MVPNGWSLVKLGDVLTLGSGDTKPTDLQKEFSDDSPYPVYGGNNIMGYSSQKNSSDSVILIGRVGEYCGVTRYINKACWITDNALYTKTVSSEIDKEYLVSKLKKFDLSRLRNKGGQPLVSQKPIYAVKLPLPPLPEQQKIAKILSTWDKAISTTEKLIATSKQQKKSLMQQLLTGKKRLLNPETGKAFEGKWEDLRVGEITIKFSNKNKSSENIRVYSVTNNSGFVKQDEHFSKEVASENRSTYKIVENGDFAYNPARINVGSIARFNGDIGIISSLYVCFKLKPKVHSEFFFQWLSTEKTKFDYCRYGEGSVRVYLWYEQFSKISVLLPSMEEQQKIASVLTAADKEIELLESKLAHLKQEKKALMQQLLTGKRRVKVDLMETV
ncbi:restriction endonuclease subunit S [Shewanella sp. SR44-3]|uniref:restriction endonuclease subunit S n=1 Tax=unclassified Shewanella TaxID=196818 RepID=UPI0015FCA8FE|nr:restriction endonuclease subunit S [Shewanella sp. SR44-3]MBB1268477.1 restriction endonuclease subunit S [Shewanella sp. SR44-3]